MVMTDALMINFICVHSHVRQYYIWMSVLRWAKIGAPLQKSLVKSNKK